MYFNNAEKIKPLIQPSIDVQIITRDINPSINLIFKITTVEDWQKLFQHMKQLSTQISKDLKPEQKLLQNY